MERAPQAYVLRPEVSDVIEALPVRVNPPLPRFLQNVQRVVEYPDQTVPLVVASLRHEGDLAAPASRSGDSP